MAGVLFPRQNMREALVKLHVSVLLAGFTGIFGKLIALNDGLLVWWRLFLTVAVMGPFLLLSGRMNLPPKRTLAVIFGVGGLQCAHWVMFYASIRLSTVSVALVCISLMGFFSAILSPLILKTPWSLRQFGFSLLTIAGIALIFHFDARYRLGIGVGVVSSAVASLFVVCNKKISGVLPPARLFFFEMTGGLALLTCLMPAYLLFFPSESLLPSRMDLFWLAFLALFGTVVLYVIQLQALEKVSAFTVNLSLNLEPVYAVILASIFLGEAKDFTPAFYLGMSLIALAVVLETFVTWKERGDAADRLLEEPQAG